MYVVLGFKVKNMKMEFNNRATWRWAMNKQGEDLLFFSDLADLFSCNRKLY